MSAFGHYGHTVTPPVNERDVSLDAVVPSCTSNQQYRLLNVQAIWQRNLSQCLLFCCIIQQGFICHLASNASDGTPPSFTVFLVCSK